MTKRLVCAAAAFLLLLAVGCQRDPGDTGTADPGTITEETVGPAEETYPGFVTDDGENVTVLYARPDSLEENVIGSRHHVSINGNPAFVYCSKATISIDGDVNYPEYVYFSFLGTADIVVEAQYDVDSVAFAGRYPV